MGVPKTVQVAPFLASGKQCFPPCAPLPSPPQLLPRECMRSLTLLLFLLLLLVPPSLANTGKHIMLVSLSLRGHVVPLARLASELTNRGHRVSFAVQDEGREHCNKSGTTIVSLGRAPAEERNKLKQISSDASFFRGILSLMSDVYLPNSGAMYKALLKAVSRDLPDLLVIDIAAVAAIDVAHLKGIPYVLNNPSVLFRMENVAHAVPSWGSGFSQSGTLWERCLQVLYPSLLAVALTPSLLDLNKLRAQRDLPPYPSPSHVFQNSLIMVNTAIGFEFPQPLSPLIKMTGPLMPLIKPVLSSSISYWLDTATKPVVVVLTGAGSMAYLEAWQVRHLAKGLTDTHFRVLWALRNEEKAALGSPIPANFRFKPNLPQLAVFAHANVKIVISSCGMATAQEALSYGKSLLCIPILGDQMDVAARVVAAGAGLSLDKTKLEIASITASVLALQRNASFPHAAKRLGKILRSVGGTRAAADVVQMGLTAGLVERLVPQSQKIPWHLANQLDVAAFCAALTILVLLAVRAASLALAVGVSKICNMLPPHLRARCSLERIQSFPWLFLRPKVAEPTLTSVYVRQHDALDSSDATDRAKDKSL